MREAFTEVFFTSLELLHVMLLSKGRLIPLTTSFLSFFSPSSVSSILNKEKNNDRQPLTHPHSPSLSCLTKICHLDIRVNFPVKNQ